MSNGCYTELMNHWTPHQKPMIYSAVANWTLKKKMVRRGWGIGLSHIFTEMERGCFFNRFSLFFLRPPSFHLVNSNVVMSSFFLVSASPNLLPWFNGFFELSLASWILSYLLTSDDGGNRGRCKPKKPEQISAREHPPLSHSPSQKKQYLSFNKRYVITMTLCISLNLSQSVVYYVSEQPKCA